MTALRKFSVLQLIGYVGVLDQSRRKIKQNPKVISAHFRHSIENCSIDPLEKEPRIGQLR